MTNETKAVAESNVAESLNATIVAAEAKEKARTSQMANVVDERLEAFFNRGVDGERFIPLKSGLMADKERFQFICDKIANMDARLDDWEESRVTKESLAKVAEELTKTAVTKADLNKFVYKVLGIIGTAVLLASISFIMAKIVK